MHHDGQSRCTEMTMTTKRMLVYMLNEDKQKRVNKAEPTKFLTMAKKIKPNQPKSPTVYQNASNPFSIRDKAGE